MKTMGAENEPTYAKDEAASQDFKNRANKDCAQRRSDCTQVKKAKKSQRGKIKKRKKQNVGKIKG